MLIFLFDVIHLFNFFYTTTTHIISESHPDSGNTVPTLIDMPMVFTLIKLCADRRHSCIKVGVILHVATTFKAFK